MEVAGLTIGAVALVSIFKDAIDLFGLFTTFRDFRHDLVILLTKLDIEKFLLLQWAQQVRLLECEGNGQFANGQLNDAYTRDLIYRILSCIKELLSDAEPIKNRYGTISASSENSLVDLSQETPNISGLCMEKLEEQFRRIKLDIKDRGHSVTGWNKARWVIKDKQKFEELISHLTHFTTKLREVLPPTSEQAQAANVVITKDLEQHQDLTRLNLLLKASSGRHQSVVESTQKAIDVQCQNRIIQTLWFRKIDDRRVSITPPHKKTLQWALEPGTECRPWSSLHQWLLTGSGFYWVSGKAGSGKSTLMKFLHSHATTKSLLSSWAGGYCNIGDFFFTYRGSPEQNTQHGLSRALLYHIVVTCPELISNVLPWMWKEANNESGVLSPPSEAEIDYAFDFISSYAELPHFCFFIDGLDEYVGNIRQGLTFISQLARNPRIKVVVSSRPIPQCVARFKNHPQLALQDLNMRDITAYIQDVIGDNDYMKMLSRNDPLQSDKIMQDLARKSSGVFLWVVLACRSLLDGFEAFDRVTELHDRVDKLPPELNDVFRLMLNRIEGRNRQQGAMLLRICYAAQKFHPREETGAMEALGLAFLSDYFDTGRADPLQVERDDIKKSKICSELRGRLGSRCGGLLEVLPLPDNLKPPCFCSFGERLKKNPVNGHDNLIDARVSFMHRSVFEFLDNDDVWKLDCLRLPASQFHHATAMSLYCLHLAVQSHGRIFNDLQFAIFVHDGLEWCAQAETTSSESSPGVPLGTSILSNSNQSRTIVELWGEFLHTCYNRLSAQSHTFKSPFPRTALVMAIEAGAVNFLQAHRGLTSLATELSPRHGYLPLLYHAIKQDFNPLLKVSVQKDLTDLIKNPITTSPMVKLLLDAGCKPNAATSAETPLGILMSTELPAEDAHFLHRVDNYLKYSTTAPIPPIAEKHMLKYGRLRAIEIWRRYKNQVIEAILQGYQVGPPWKSYDIGDILLP